MAKKYFTCLYLLYDPIPTPCVHVCVCAVIRKAEGVRCIFPHIHTKYLKQGVYSISIRGGGQLPSHDKVYDSSGKCKQNTDSMFPAYFYGEKLVRALAEHQIRISSVETYISFCIRIEINGFTKRKDIFRRVIQHRWNQRSRDASRTYVFA